MNKLYSRKSFNKDFGAKWDFDNYAFTFALCMLILLILSCIGKSQEPNPDSLAHYGKTKTSTSKFVNDSIQVNINTAGVDSLSLLPGIGEKTALEIIAYREQNNGFKSVYELLFVPRIGNKKFARMFKQLKIK